MLTKFMCSDLLRSPGQTSKSPQRARACLVAHRVPAFAGWCCRSVNTGCRPKIIRKPHISITFRIGRSSQGHDARMRPSDANVERRLPMRTRGDLGLGRFDAERRSRERRRKMQRRSRIYDTCIGTSAICRRQCEIRHLTGTIYLLVSNRIRMSSQRLLHHDANCGFGAHGTLLSAIRATGRGQAA